MEKKDKKIKEENIDEQVKESCNCGNDCNCGDDGCNCECNNENDNTIELEEKIKELEEKVLLANAELINYRKRKDDEVSNMLKFANQDMIMELIPILDNFERAMAVKTENAELEKYLSGIKIVYNNFVDTLKKYGVEEIPALGLVFDPKCHEAITTGCDKEKEDEVVLEVLIKGYKLKDRIIRPAVVKVNKLDN